MSANANEGHLQEVQSHHDLPGILTPGILPGILTPFNTLRIGRWTFGHHICMIITSMVVILLSASIFNFVAVNIDPLVCIKMPLVYKEMKDRRWMVKVAIFACWVLALVPAVPMWTSYDTRTARNDGTCYLCSFPYESVSITLN